MDYVLDRLGATNFHVLVSGLVRESTGHGLDVISAGPLRTSAESTPVNLRWPEHLGGEVWGGSVVVDVLYVPSPERTSWTSAQLTAHLRTRFATEANQRMAERHRRLAEIAFENRTPGSVDRVPADVMDDVPLPSLSDLPDYLVFVTNLSFAEMGSAADDVVHDALTDHQAELGFRTWKVWDRSSVSRVLDAAPLTRRRYLANLAPTDILNRIAEYDVGVSARLMDQMKLQVVNELEADQWIRPSQAAGSEETKLPLSTAGIDLPVKDETRMAARLIIETADLRSFPRLSNQRQNVLLLGGPGQGKSTIGQLLSQCYRVALLSGSIDPDHSKYALAERLRQGFLEANIPLPELRRWPIRVELAKYVDAATNHRQTSLIGYIAALVDKRAGGMSGAKIRAWLRAWPWLLILDGLDEVASAEGRNTVMDQVSTFANEVESVGADVFVVATTRPQGYAGEFAQQRYRDYELAPLETRRAIEYGTKLADARHGDDPDMHERVVERLNRSAEDKRTARLMRSPLQVTIMSILLEARERVPRARYELFDAYYEAIYMRESSKPGPLGQLLGKRRADINALHNWLGVLLQVNSERAGGLDASIPSRDLRVHAIHRLENEGYDRWEAAELADEIIKAVTTRLVLIVPTKMNDVGFEVRSIQEFFAARALVSDADDKVLDRLSRIIEPAHWRNTWLFAAGKAFLEREHLRRDIVRLLSDIDDSDLLRMVAAPGADLALDLLEDDVASSSPGLQRSLCRQALELLKYPPDTDLGRRASVLFQTAEADSVSAALLEQAVDAAAGGAPAQLEAAQTMLMLADRRATPLAIRFRPRLRAIERTARSSPAPAPVTSSVISETFTTVLSTTLIPDADRWLVDELVARLLDEAAESDPEKKPVRDDVVQDVARSELLDRCLTREPIADVIAKATLEAAKRDSNASAVLRNLIRAWLQRRNAGTAILESVVDG